MELDGAGHEARNDTTSYPFRMPMPTWEFLNSEDGELFYFGSAMDRAGGRAALAAIEARRLGQQYMHLAWAALRSSRAWLGWFCGFTAIPQATAEAALAVQATV
jgi:hypothetical protein